MPAKQRFLIVGLGVLGNSVALTLKEEGAEVIVVDRSSALVEAIRDRVDIAVVADVTDRKVLEQIGARDVDGAVVCIGEHFEAAVLATAHLLDLNTRHVAVRANGEVAASILKRLGAHQVFFVEHIMGKVIAHKLTSKEVVHEMDLGEGYRVVQIQAPEEIVGKSLAELKLPSRYNIQVIAVRPADGKAGMTRPDPTTVIRYRDTLLISGHQKDLGRFFDRRET